MAAEQRPFPVLQTRDAIVIRELRRATDQKAVTDFFFIFVLGPTIAVGAKRDFLPLSGLMVVANLGELLAIPHSLYTLLEHVAHIGALESIEATDRHSAVVMYGQGLVEGRAGQSLFRWFHIRKRS